MNLIDVIKSNDTAMFEELVSNTQGYNVLHNTIARDRLELSRIAIRLRPEFVFEIDYPLENSPLMYAIKSLKLDMVKLFDKYPLAFTIPNGSGELPLITAIKCGRSDIFSYTYEKYPEAVSWRNEKGQTPLHIACQYGASQEIIRILYTETQDIADDFGNFPIHYLCGDYASDNDESSFAFLARRNPRVLSMKNEVGNTPFHCLAMFSTASDTNYDDIATLFTHATLNIGNNVGMLSVHIAALFHNVELVLKMISADPSILYKYTPTLKTICSFLENCSDADILQFFTFILSEGFEVTSELWKFFPKNFKNLEKQLHKFQDAHVYKCVQHLTRHGKYQLLKNLTFLFTYTQRCDIRIPPQLIQKIVLKSL